MTAAPNPRTATVRGALGGIDLAAVLADVAKHGHCFPAIVGARPDWCSGCNWQGADPEGAGQ